MTTRHGWIGTALLATSLLTGCHGDSFYRGGAIAADPAFVAGDPAFVAGGPVLLPGEQARPVTFWERHPLFRKPADYYHGVDGPKCGKLATATFIGIPAGVISEVKQIICGCPPGL